MEYGAFLSVFSTELVWDVYIMSLECGNKQRVTKVKCAIKELHVAFSSAQWRVYKARNV